jgi:uncharacterized protein (DUF736 family)
MAVIGTFTKDGAGFTGHIETLTMRAKLTLEPNTNKKSDKSPDYRVLHFGDGFTSEIGVAWNRTAKKSGSQYVSISIHDDPALDKPLNCRLIKTGAESGYTLFWDRPEKPGEDREVA